MWVSQLAATRLNRLGTASSVRRGLLSLEPSLASRSLMRNGTIERPRNVSTPPRLSSPSSWTSLPGPSYSKWPLGLRHHHRHSESPHWHRLVAMSSPAWPTPKRRSPDSLRNWVQHVRRDEERPRFASPHVCTSARSHTLISVGERRSLVGRNLDCLQMFAGHTAYGGEHGEAVTIDIADGTFSTVSLLTVVFRSHIENANDGAVRRPLHGSQGIPHLHS
mmetsp:Transcript_4415/g.10711  ORF Transcript_4415/g.10711 Transcript_4415/m.10711 type:complete len:220 (+) Transcript_4415:1026-1685(+)